MKFATVAAATVASVSTLVSASPIIKRDAATDILVLQFALTLEHLENAFYSQYLAKFSDQDFIDAGFESWVKGRVSQIGTHEASHVALLAGALGTSATQPCTYNFGAINTARDFINTAYIIENVGTSAYLGAAPLISEPAYLAVAGAILTTEARHQGWESASGLRREGWASGAYDTALAPAFIYDIVAPYFVSCPSTNYALPFTAAAATTFDYATGAISYDGVKDGDFAVLLQGLGSAAYPISGGKVTGYPTNVQGIAYLIPSSSGNVTELATSALASPAIISVSFSSKVANPALVF